MSSFSYDPRFKEPSPEVMRRMELSRLEAEKIQTREMRCPICGEEITVPLATHMRGHPVVPCPVCGNMMPSGRNSKCFNCGYVSSEAGSELLAGGKDTVKSTNSTIFLDSKC